MKTKGFRVAALFSALILSLVLGLSGGCSKSKPAATVLQSPYGDEKLPEIKIPATTTYVWPYVAREKGWLNETFEQYGIKASIVQYNNVDEVQLIARGDMHFATRMLYPYLVYRTQGADLIGVHVSLHPRPDVASILVLNDSPFQSFDDLKNKRLASWRAGCPYMVLFEIAERRNWKQGTDWTYVNIPSGEQKNALLSREVDAVSVHLSGDIAQMFISGLVREVANPAVDSVYVNGGGVSVVFTSPKFAAEYPKTTKAYLNLQKKTEQWMLDNVEEATKLVESILRIPPDISKLAWARRESSWKTSPLDFESIKRETKVMQDWLVAHGDIDASKQVNPDILFDPQYFN